MQIGTATAFRPQVFPGSNPGLPTILKHIDPNDCLGRLTIVQQCVLIWAVGVVGGTRALQA